jgi:hypothetical protein
MTTMAAAEGAAEPQQHGSPRPAALWALSDGYTWDADMVRGAAARARRGAARRCRPLQISRPLTRPFFPRLARVLTARPAARSCAPAR